MTKRGRPRFEPTGEQRRNVEIMTGLGILQTEICLMVRGPKGKPISLATLEKYFRKKIDTGATNLRTRVGNFMISVIMGRIRRPALSPLRTRRCAAAFWSSLRQRS